MSVIQQKMITYKMCEYFAAFKFMRSKEDMAKLSVVEVLKMVPEMFGEAEFSIVDANKYCEMQIFWRKHHLSREHQSFELVSSGAGFMTLEGDELKRLLNKFAISPDDKRLVAGSYIVAEGGITSEISKNAEKSEASLALQVFEGPKESKEFKETENCELAKSPAKAVIFSDRYSSTAATPTEATVAAEQSNEKTVAASAHVLLADSHSVLDSSKP